MVNQGQIPVPRLKSPGDIRHGKAIRDSCLLFQTYEGYQSAPSHRMAGPWGIPQANLVCFLSNARGILRGFNRIVSPGLSVGEPGG